MKEEKVAIGSFFGIEKVPYEYFNCRNIFCSSKKEKMKLIYIIEYSLSVVWNTLEVKSCLLYGVARIPETVKSWRNMANKLKFTYLSG